MNDLSMHLLDIVQNSISAGAKLIVVGIDEDVEGDVLTISVEDDGKGMTEEQVKRLPDPFFTSRTTRRVGMGIPLLMHTAEQCGGNVHIESEVGKGTKVTATFGYSNIDRPPLGDFVNTVALLISANPSLDFVLNYSKNGSSYEFKTTDARTLFGDNALENISLVKKIEHIVQYNILEMA